MKITCHACDAKYTIADEKVTGRTVKIKCKKCGATIVVNADPAAAGGGAVTGAPAYAEPQAHAHGEDDSLMATRVVGSEAGSSPAAAEWTVSVSAEDERQMSQLQMAEEMQRGVITGDTYVWKDGMSDWLSVSQVPELAALLARAAPQAAAPAPYAAPSPYAPPAAPSAVQEENLGLAGTIVMSDSSAMSPFAAPRPAAGAAAAPAPAAALSPVNQPTAARRAGRAGASVDVFQAAAETREAEAPPARERPKPPTPAGRLGERNENSVLFSLSALTATENAAAKSSASDDAVLDMGFGRNNGKSSAVDDLMNIGGGGIGSPMLAPPPLLAPVVEPPPAPAPMPVAAAPSPMSMNPAAMGMPMQQPKSKTGLIIGIVAGVLVLGGVGAFFALSGSPATPTADTSAPSATVTSAPAATTSAEPTATVTSAPTATEAPAASGAPAASSAVASNDSKTPSSGTGGGPAPTGKASASASTKPSADPVASAPPTATAAPTATDTGGGGRDFNKGAATTALSAAASAAKGCKQPGGPTGSASVRVVFAPSGNVTSANVQGPPFAGTPVGGCIAAAFRGAHVPAFDGSPVAVSKTVNIN